jgi:metallophosphoesterase (TIGR00282 family)
VLRKGLRWLRREYRPDLIVVNGENAAGGAGITPNVSDEIFRGGVHVVTTGNHVWDRKEGLPHLDDHPFLLRPANYPEPAPGHGWCVAEAENGIPVAVVNLMGRVFMEDLDDPFRVADDILRELRDTCATIIVDFHAEATSEKAAVAWHLDGRVSAVLGTHTHVTTADERILPGGTAFQSDVGMTGPRNSIIGVSPSSVLRRFRTQRPTPFLPAEGPCDMAATLVTVAPDTGHAEAIARVRYEEPA